MSDDLTPGESVKARADRLYEEWNSPEAVAERDAMRARCNSHFDAVRDKALRELFGEWPLVLTHVGARS